MNERVSTHRAPRSALSLYESTNTPSAASYSTHIGDLHRLHAVDRLPYHPVENLVQSGVTPASGSGSITVPVSIALDYYTHTTGTPISSIPTLFVTSSVPTTTPSATGSTIAPSYTSANVINSGTTSFLRVTSSSSSAHASPTTSAHGSPSTSGMSHAHLLPAIAVGGAVVLCSAVLAMRLLSRRRKVVVRNISKPIVQSVFEADSPIFGTSEKFNDANNGENSIWTWTQYQGSPASPSNQTSCDEKTIDNTFADIKLDESSLASTHVSGNAPTLVETLHKSISRLSAMSALMFPRPPSISRDDMEAGGRSPVTIYPATVYPDADDCDSQRLTVMSRLSARTSAYGGYLSSPLPPPTPAPLPDLPRTALRSTPSTSSRARIQAPYTVGHHKRPSTTTITGAPMASSNAVYALPPLPPLRTSAAYFDLTASEGLWPLASDIQSEASSAAELDEDQQRQRLRQLAVQSVEHASAAMEERRRQREQLTRSVSNASAALGNLMLTGFDASSVSAPRGKSSTSISSLKVSKRVDRPPRVPSPPPLPALDQITITHDNEYRSPTYSLYTYYGPDAL
jgi:hypothetical protein